MTRKRAKNIDEKAAQYPIRLFVFDVLLAGQHDCLPEAQCDRTRRLRSSIRSTARSPIAVTEAVVTIDARELHAYFDRSLDRGLEGVVAKRVDAPYRAGARGFDWVKLKRAYQSALRDTVHVVLGGYRRARGKRSALGTGSLVGAICDAKHDRFRTVAKIGSGLSDVAWKALRGSGSIRCNVDATGACRLHADA